MQKWNDTQEGVKFPIKWNQSYEGEHRFFDFDRVINRRTLTSPRRSTSTEVVCFVRRKSPTAAVARKTYSINLGEESHVDNN